MHRVALIYNPVSGQHPQRRAALIKRVVAVLHSAAIEVKVIPTESAESVGTQAQEPIREGCGTILACGGDGTVHEVLQSVVGTSAALGVIPMGTANALASCGPWSAGISGEGREDVACRYPSAGLCGACLLSR